MTSERLRTLRWVALYALVGLAVYMTALMFCFPYNRVKEMAIAMAAQAGFDLEIGSAGPAFPIGISFEDIHLQPRGLAPTPTKLIRVHLESARVPFIPLVFSGGKSFELVVRGLGGRIALAMSSRKGGPLHEEVHIDDLSLGQVPGLRELWNLPVAGTLHASARLDSATGRLADANGEIEFKCSACTVGDGKSAVKFGGANPFLAAGLTLPRVRLGDFAGRVVIEKGVARAQGVAIKSADAELTLDGEVILRDPMAYSGVNAYVRFKLGDALLKNASAIASVLQMAGAPGLRPDGFYGLRLSGSFAALSVLLSPTSSVGSAPGPARSGGRAPVVPTEVAPLPPPIPAAVPPAPAVAPPPPPPPPPAAVVVPSPPPPPLAPAALAAAIPTASPPGEAPLPPPAVVRGAPVAAGAGPLDGARGGVVRNMASTLASTGGTLGGVGPAAAGGGPFGPAPPGPPVAPGPPQPPGPPVPPGPPLPPGSPVPPAPPAPRGQDPTEPSARGD